MTVLVPYNVIYKYIHIDLALLHSLRHAQIPSIRKIATKNVLFCLSGSLKNGRADTAYLCVYIEMLLLAIHTMYTYIVIFILLFIPYFIGSIDMNVHWITRIISVLDASNGVDAM